jgi:hypothetical protein
VIFITGIIAAVGYLSITKKDVILKSEKDETRKAEALKDENT